MSFPDGLWFQAACSGLWYENRHAAGSVSNIMLDGVMFTGPPRPDVCEHGIPEGDWCETCNRAYKEAAADPENHRSS